MGVFHSAYSQIQSTDIGLRGSLGAAYFLNANFSKPGVYESYRFTLSDNYGLQTAFNFSYGCGLEVGILDGVLTQGYSGNFSTSGRLPAVGITYMPGESYSGEVKINIIQVPVLFRYEPSKKAGNYFEAGLGYDLISSANYSATYSHPDFSVHYNTTKLYPAGNFLVIVGLGKDTRLAKRSHFYWNIGIRFICGLMDLQGVDGHGQSTWGNPALYDPNSGPPYYSQYRTTHSFDFSLNTGIFYRIFPHNVYKRQMDF